MESNKQEKYNLMHDNPVASHASWMSKHAQSSRMSPLNQEKQDFRKTVLPQWLEQYIAKVKTPKN